LPLINPIQPTFAGGEYSPSIYPRVDIEKYRSGLKTCRNFYVHPHGGASNRPGTKYIASSKYTDKLSVVRNLIFSETEAYALEFGENYIRFFKDQAQIIPEVSDEWSTATAYSVNDFVTYIASTTTVASTYLCTTTNGSTAEPPETYPSSWANQNIYEIWSPYAEEDLRDLKLESSADVIWITHKDYQTRTLTRYGDANWVLALYKPQDGPFMPTNTTTTTLIASALTGSVSLTASSALFAAGHVGALWKLTHYVEGNIDSQSFTGTGTGTAIDCFTTWRVISHGTWTGKFRIELSSDSGSTWSTLRSFTSVNDYNANTFGTEDISLYTEPVQVRVNMYEYTSGTCNVDLTTDSFYQNGIVEITAFHGTTSVTGTVIQDIGKTTSTDDWAEGSWSTYRGFPKVSRFYQDRLCFGGTPAEPMTIWMTKTGNYYSFVRHATLLDTDGISTNLPSRQLNAINGMIVLQRLVVFTNASEFSIGPASGAAVTPTNIDQRIEGYRGSDGITPVVVGNEMMYVQKAGKVIRNFGYELGSDSFTGSELNILSKHLFDKWDIVDLAYQQDPDSLVWALRDDGILLCMTYMREQEVVAWSWMDTGSVADNDVATVNSCTTIPGDGYDELWITVTRGNKRFVEVLSKRIGASECLTGGKQFRAENAYFVDSGVSYGSGIKYLTSIQLTDPIKVTAEAHGFSNADIVRLDNLTEWETLNATSWTINNVTANTFELQTQVVE
jgi:hypothetical protein